MNTRILIEILEKSCFALCKDMTKNSIEFLWCTIQREKISEYAIMSDV